MTHGNTKHVYTGIPVHSVRGQRVWFFTFSEQWGPLLTDKYGEPVDNAPLADEQHPFWDKFEAWQAKGTAIQ